MVRDWGTLSDIQTEEFNWKKYQDIQMSVLFPRKEQELDIIPHYTPYSKLPDVYLFHLMMSLMLLALATFFFLLMAYVVRQ